MPSNFGTYNYRCEVYAPKETRDSAYNSVVVAWSRVGSFHCVVNDILPRNDENITEQRMQVSAQRAKMRIQYTNTYIDSTMRVVVLRGGVKRIYKIVSEGAEIGYRDAIEFQIERLLPSESDVMIWG